MYALSRLSSIKTLDLQNVNGVFFCPETSWCCRWPFLALIGPPDRREYEVARYYHGIYIVLLQ